VLIVPPDSDWTSVAPLPTTPRPMPSDPSDSSVVPPLGLTSSKGPAAAGDKRAEATYEDADAVLHTSLDIQRHLAAQYGEIEKILTELQQLQQS
jgi:hypothetical protein